MDNTLKHSLFFLLLGLLALGFWFSADFKTIVAGIAVFLFGMLSLQKGFKFFLISNDLPLTATKPLDEVR